MRYPHRPCSPRRRSALTRRAASTLALAAALCAPSSVSAQPAGFPTLNDIVQQMTNAAANHPAICQLVNLTQTYGTPQTWEGRDIYAVKISDNVAVEEDEQSFMMVSAHHGNEYGTPIVALDAISRLTDGYASEPEIQRLVDTYEIWIAPVWNPDGYWTSRTNSRPTGGIDLNRNYPFLWSSPCNTGVKGPSPGSEPETQTMVAWSEDQRFTKVLDFHSSGREVLYAYRQSCPNHQLTSYLRAEAVALSSASSYGGQVRGPSSNGEHYQWQLGAFSNYAFLTEISNTQSPSISSALTEATRLWPGTVWMLDRPVPVWGHVTDATSGAPIEANISYVENPFTQGERNRSEPRFGRFHAFLPNGTHTLRFEHPSYITQDIQVAVTSAGTQVEVQLQALGSGVPNAPSDLVASPSTGRIDLTWNDNSGDEDFFRLEKSSDSSTFFLIANLPANTTAYSDLGLPNSTTYWYRVQAANPSGVSAWSNVASAMTPGTAVDYVATSDTAIEGQVSGSFTATQTGDGVDQWITEVIAGRNRKQTSSLEHHWTVGGVPLSGTKAFHVLAYQSPSSDGDNFAFEYGTANRRGKVSWTRMVTISGTAPAGYATFAMPSSLSGDVLIRVVDTNSRRNAVALDTVFVDHLFVRVQ